MSRFEVMGGEGSAGWTSADHWVSGAAAGEHAIPADAFAPLQQRQPEDCIARPAISYWRHVWLRFRQNKLALVALMVVLLLVLCALLGPLVWRVDPSVQSIGSRSLGPALERSAELLPWQPWQPAADAWQRPFSGVVVAAANTEFVRLLWRAVPDAQRYAVYRVDGRQRGRGSMGIPLGDVSQPWLEDRLDLRAGRYVYTILAYDADAELLQRMSQVVQPSLAIGMLEAQLEGLVALDAPLGGLEGTMLPLPAHPLGTDHLGRDMLARLMLGGRISLFIGVVAPLCFVLFGALYGGVAGYAGGRVDELMMRVADFVVALPFLLFMILFRVLFGIEPGESGISAMLVAMVLLGWPSTARLVRGQVLQLKALAFVNAARVLGGRPFYIIIQHMLPNVMGVLLVSLTFAIPSAIFTEAFLSFIGLGVAPPVPSWGSMCNDGMRTMLSHPHELLFPAMTISLAVLAFNLLGDALRDAFDIRMKGGVGHG
jgi:oligopeptide transport system permease protein